MKKVTIRVHASMQSDELARTHERVKRWALDKDDDDGLIDPYAVEMTTDHDDDRSIVLTVRHGDRLESIRAPMRKWNHPDTDYCTYLLDILCETAMAVGRT